MTLTSWLGNRRSNLENRLPKSRRLRKSRGRRYRHLFLERLEDRTLLNGGGLDPAFGTGGLVTTSILGSTQTQVDGVVLQSADNKIVVGGTVRASPASPRSVWALARYLPDGKLDTDPVNGFGPLYPSGASRAGTTTFDPVPGQTGSDFLGGMVLEPNGQIVIAGGIPTSPFSRAAALARFNTDGTLDTTFGPAGSGGIVTDSFLTFANASAITLVNNEIIIGGNGYDANVGRTAGFVARFSLDGIQDASFGGGSGNAIITFGGSQGIFSGLAADNTGRIVVIGSVLGLPSNSPFRMSRLNSDGTPDAAFGVLSGALSHFFPSAVTIQPDQNIVVAGSVANGVSTFGVQRFTSSGSVDATFGQNGSQTTGFGGNDATAQSIVLQPDGMIVVAGTVQVLGTGTSEGEDDFALARLTSSGMPDTGFGINGQVTTNFGLASGQSPTFDEVGSMLIQADGNIVVAGTSHGIGPQLFALARYLGGSAPAGFGEVRGSKWIDSDGDGLRQAVEAGIQGATIFVDLNRDGRLDQGEPSAMTDANGDYDIQNVPAGTYPVIDESANTSLLLPDYSNSADLGFSVAAGAGMIVIGDPEALRLDPATSFAVPLGRAYLFDAQDGLFRRELPAPPPQTNPLFPNRDAFGFSVAIHEKVGNLPSGFIEVGSPFRWETVQFPDTDLLAKGAAFFYLIDDLSNPQEVTFDSISQVLFFSGPYSQLQELEEAVGQGGTDLGLAFASLFSTTSGNFFFLSGGISGPGFQNSFVLGLSEHGNPLFSFGEGNGFDSLATTDNGQIVLGGSPDGGIVQVFLIQPLDPSFGDPKLVSAAILMDPIRQNGSSFGTSVALLGTQGFVGAPGENNPDFQAGAVFRFDNLDSTPTLGRLFLDPDRNANNHFGFSLATVGTDEILIGAPGDSTFGPDAGAVYLFDAETGDLLQTFYGPNPHAGAQFGFSLADIDTQSFVVGAPSTGDDSDPGAAYLMRIAPMVTVAPGRVAAANFPKIPGPQGATIQAVEGADIGLQTVATFADPSASNGHSSASASIDWGDGTNIVNAAISIDPNSRHFQVQGSHTYAEEGTYSITITITSGDGSVLGIVNSTANVSDPVLIPQRVPLQTIYEGLETDGVTFLTFTDPGGPEALTEYSASIDWGDNSTDIGTILLDFSTDNFSVLGFHQYEEEGTYSININLHHEGKTYSILGIPANVKDAPLTPILNQIQVGAIAGGPFNGAVGRFFDSDPHGTPSDYSATIDWGDRTTSMGVFTAIGTGSLGAPFFNISGTHTYASAASYTIRIHLRDLGGSEFDIPTIATVSNLGSSVSSGLAGGAGFWHNRNGQALINSFNGGSADTALSSWLATTFPNLYGVGAGLNNLTGFTNAQVASFYQNLFGVHGPKFDADVLGLALDVYATTQSLGGNAGTTYGFHVTSYGLGAYSYNVGASGRAFGVPNNTVLNVFQILQAVNLSAVNGILYNGDRTLDLLALPVFDGIATAGSI